MKPKSPTLIHTPEEKSASPYDIITCKHGISGCKNSLLDTKTIADRIKEILDELGLGEYIKSKAKAKILYHMKFKAAIAGCPNSCSQPQIKDFGISGQARPIATKNTCTECMECVRICKEKGAVQIIDARPIFDYTLCVLCGDCAKVCPTEAIIIEKKGARVMANGKLGRHPKLADMLAELADEDEVYKLLDKLVSERIKKE
ncbi:MAG: 4Fe-4S binding protein [Deltaproteobacteria bacterium]|nr:4Fe-4S binding protein [Deltaproteobacteria bacterium]